MNRMRSLGLSALTLGATLALVPTTAWGRQDPPRASIGADVFGDDQPLRRLRVVGTLEAPLARRGRAYLTGDARSYDRAGLEGRRVLLTQLAAWTSLPGTPLTLAGGAGYLASDLATRAHPVWSARVSTRLPAHLVAHAGVERTPYLTTRASLDRRVAPTTASFVVDWSRRGGWLAQASLARTQHEDDNTIRSAYAWLLAPVLTRPTAQLRVGVASAYDDADVTRYGTFAEGGTPGRSVVGYAPYFTPEHQRTRSLLVDLVTWRATGLVFRGAAGYGVDARELRPALRATGTPPSNPPGNPGRPNTPTAPTGALLFASQRYFPWNVRASLERPVGPAGRVVAEGHFEHLAFYQAGTLALRYERRLGRAR